MKEMAPRRASFVNNHFWNCYEEETGGDAASASSSSTIVVEVVPATERYLDSYFSHTLAASALDWMSIFHPPLRCKVRLEAGAFEQPDPKKAAAGDRHSNNGGAAAGGPPSSSSSSSSVECEEIGQSSRPPPFDYPTLTRASKVRLSLLFLAFPCPSCRCFLYKSLAHKPFAITNQPNPNANSENNNNYN